MCRAFLRIIPQLRRTATPNAGPAYALDRLSRYEATLCRQIERTLFALDALDRRKPQERRLKFCSCNLQSRLSFEGERCSPPRTRLLQVDRLIMACGVQLCTPHLVHALMLGPVEAHGRS
jgi:hypothetical protein